VAVKEDSDSPPVPMTVRQLEAMVRISESLARMQLSTSASEEHAQQAIDLFSASTIDAMKSGITHNVTFSNGQVRDTCWLPRSGHGTEGLSCLGFRVFSGLPWLSRMLPGANV
jgi:MCM AAA-lid domain